MDILIKKNASTIYIRREPLTVNWDWASKLEEIEGMLIKVETEFLFKDQFNTAPIPGVSESGMRIMQNVVEEVIDDERLNKVKCNWCGTVSNDNDTVCLRCEKSEYLKHL